MRRWWTVLLAVLLMASCHRGKKTQPVDSMGTVPQKDTVAIIADTIVADTTSSTAVTPARTTTHTLQQETAETTNLRLFARKQQTLYSPALMVGEWQRGQEHEQFLAGGSGRRWDTSDDVYREEAQTFHWTMDSNLLMMKYPMSLGGLVVRQYVVTFVDDETMVYRDAYGGSYMWDKVPAGFNDRPAQPAKE